MNYRQAEKKLMKWVEDVDTIDAVKMFSDILNLTAKAMEQYHIENIEIISDQVDTVEYMPYNSLYMQNRVYVDLYNRIIYIKASKKLFEKCS